MNNSANPVVDGSPKIKRLIDLLYKVALTSWVALFIGLLASSALVIAGQAYSPAAAVAGYLFVGGAAGFIAGMLPIGILGVAELLKPCLMKKV